MDAPASSSKAAGQSQSAPDSSVERADVDRMRAHGSKAAGQSPVKDSIAPPNNDPANSLANGSSGGSNDGKAAAKPSIKPLDIVVPDEIGRYTIGGKIGSGTCGVVHLGLDNVLRREVAIKLSPIGEAHVSTGKVPGAQRAYQTEIVAAGRLSHPGIVTVYDAGQYEDLNYLVMEAVDGVSLKQYGKGQSPLPIHRSLEIIVDCCHALDYSHAQDIIHRDIKPANIMLGDDGSVKILDFGIAVGLTGEAGLSKQGPTLGTPNYMSPEQILGKDLGPSSDFYSLATVLFELLTSRQLFKAQKVKDLFRTVVNQRAPRLNDVKPELPDALADVLSKALEKKPERRYQSGADMAAELVPFIERFRIVEQRPVAQQRFIKQLQFQQFFSTFSDVEIAQLLEIVRVKTFSPGDMLIDAGDVERRLFVVTNGMVKVTENDDLIRLCAEGQCIGELGFIHGAPETKKMQALTDVNVLEVSADSLSDLPPKVHLHYYRVISDVLVARLATEGKLQPDISL